MTTLQSFAGFVSKTGPAFTWTPAPATQKVTCRRSTTRVIMTSRMGFHRNEFREFPKRASLLSLRAMGDTAFTLMFYEMAVYAEALSAQCAGISMGWLRPEAALGLGAVLGLWTVAEALKTRVQDAANDARDCAAGSVQLASEWDPYLNSIDAVLATSPPPIRSSNTTEDLSSCTLEEVEDILVWIDEEVAGSGLGAELLNSFAKSPQSEIRLAIANFLTTLTLSSNSLVGVACRLAKDSDPQVAEIASSLDLCTAFPKSSPVDGEVLETRTRATALLDSISGLSSPLHRMKTQDLQALCTCAALSVMVELTSALQGFTSGEVHFVGLGWLLAVTGAFVYPLSKEATRTIESQQVAALSSVPTGRHADRWTGLD